MERRLHSVELWIAPKDVEFCSSVSIECFLALTFCHLLNELQKCHYAALSYVLAFLIVNCKMIISK